MTDSIDRIQMHREIEEGQLRRQLELEVLAAVQHEIWSHWMKYLFSQCPEFGMGVSITRYIPADKVIHWKRQMETPYAELSEKEKDSDRDQARKVMDALAIGGFSIRENGE